MIAPSPASVDVVQATLLSLQVAAGCVIAGLPVAVALGWVLARVELPGKPVLAAVVLAPLVLPPVVTGLLILQLFGREALLGRALSVLGLHVPFTLLGATLAAFVVGMPLFVSAARAAFEGVDPVHEQVARTLGLGPWATFTRVTLPLAARGIAAGAVLAFARALGEFGATAVVAGNVAGKTRTIALAIYTLWSTPGGAGAMWTLAGVSVAISVVALWFHERLMRQRRGA